MIERGSGNLLEAQVDALVNTVNTEGVMGKGIALQFKKAFPASYDVYRKECDAGRVQTGKVLVVHLGRSSRATSSTSPRRSTGATRRSSTT